MALFGKKKKIMGLEERIAYLEENASPEFKAVERMNAEIESLEAVIAELEETKSTEQELTRALQGERSELEAKVKDLSDQIINLEEEYLMQEFGIYEPRYDFMTVDEYKAEIDRTKAKQKGIAKQMNEDENQWIG